MTSTMILAVSILVFIHLEFAVGKYGYEDSSTNLLINWDLEDGVFNNTQWYCDSTCTVEENADAKTGQYSAFVHTRSASNSGAHHRAKTLSENTRYYFSMFVKFLEPGSTDTFKPLLVAKTKYDNDSTNRETIAHMPFTSPSNATWLQVGGDILTPDEGFKFVEFYLKNVPPANEYLLDTSSLFELDPNSNWTAEADERIQQERTNTITTSGSIPEQYTVSLMEIQVTQTRHDFQFGSMIKSADFVDEGTFPDSYRDYFYGHYEWATIGNGIKWKQMEAVEGVVEYDELDDTIGALESNNTAIRAHNVFYDKEDNNPAWVQPLTGQDMLDAIDSRINSSILYFNNSISQWVVSNEFLAEQFYEDATDDPDILLTMFADCHTAAPNAELFINENTVVNKDGHMNSAVHNLGKHLLDNSAPLYGVGIQSHHTDISVPIEVIHQRLDIIAEIGLPIVITELTVHSTSVSERAAFFENVLRLYFSYPDIEGIIVWGFCDQNMPDTTAALAEGTGCVSNAAGEVWEDLVLDEWTTNETFEPTSRNFSHSFNGYHGNYDLKVYYDGDLLCSETFNLASGVDKDITLQFC